LSNSWNWICKEHWCGVLVEADSDNFKKIATFYQSRADVHCLHEFVSEKRSIDTLPAGKDVPYDFDLLSIDIDGMEYQLWAA